ncbi:MAG TPA: acyltransferase [Xanthobacteraceae bacterium]|nr:acyltransferase [Xanthobacteraceae bacterium]
MSKQSERDHSDPGASRRSAIPSETSQALKNLRAFAIVMVVSFHSLLAYLASQPAAPEPFDSPPYHWLATPILDNQRWLAFDIYAAFQYVALMPVMFFLSGIFVWPSLVRRGSWNFFYGRLLRIGLPFVFGVYLLMPIAYYPVYRVTAADPSWLAYWRHWTALPFWPGGPLWFLWELLLFDILALVAYLAAPRLIEMLGRFSMSAGAAPRRYFVALLAVSGVAYLPLAFAFGVSSWAEFGPFDWQPDRLLLYLVYFFAGVGIGVEGYDRGLLRPGGALARRWRIWLSCAGGSFLLWMISMAPSAFGRSNLVIDLCSYFAVVLVVAAVCLGFAAVFLRFGSARSALTDSLSENAYAIYLVHYVFVVWLQYALLGSTLPAAVKGVLVFASTLLLSWGAAVGAGRLASLARQFSNIASSAGWRSPSSRRVRPSG